MKKKITLSDIPNEMPFKVPDGYFDKMESEILAKTIDNQFMKPKTKKKNIYFWPMGIAASILILTGIFWVNFENDTKKTEKVISDISYSQTANYLEKENLDVADIQSVIEITEADLEAIEIENLPMNNIENEPKFFEELEKGLLN